jgi:hypothetical protein
MSMKIATPNAARPRIDLWLDGFMKGPDRNTGQSPYFTDLGVGRSMDHLSVINLSCAECRSQTEAI